MIYSKIVILLLLPCYSETVPQIALLLYWPAVKTASYIKCNWLYSILYTSKCILAKKLSLTNSRRLT